MIAATLYGEPAAVDGEATRRRLQAAFFRRWTRLYPVPRRRDGASPEEIQAAEGRSELARRIVLTAWYGVPSMKEVEARKALYGWHSIGWLAEASDEEFEAAVREALAAGGAR